MFVAVSNFFFWDICWNHCSAALDLWAGVEQPFDCLIVQNHQAVQSMRRSMDWTLEDNMVDGLFFCATLTGRRGGHAQFIQTGAETPDTGAEAVKPDPGSSWCRSGVWVGWNCGVLWGCPTTLHSTDDPPSAPQVCCCYQMNWWVLVRRVQMGVSIWGAVHLHSMDGWVLSGEGAQAPWHDVLQTVWLHCDETQQVECLRGLEGCPLV